MQSLYLGLGIEMEGSRVFPGHVPEWQRNELADLSLGSQSPEVSHENALLDMSELPQGQGQREEMQQFL